MKDETIIRTWGAIQSYSHFKSKVRDVVKMLKKDAIRGERGEFNRLICQLDEYVESQRIMGWRGVFSEPCLVYSRLREKGLV